MGASAEAFIDDTISSMAEEAVATNEAWEDKLDPQVDGYTQRKRVSSRRFVVITTHCPLCGKQLRRNGEYIVTPQEHYSRPDHNWSALESDQDGQSTFGDYVYETRGRNERPAPSQRGRDGLQERDSSPTTVEEERETEPGRQDTLREYTHGALPSQQCSPQEAQLSTARTGSSTDSSGECAGRQNTLGDYRPTTAVRDDCGASTTAENSAT